MRGVLIRASNNIRVLYDPFVHIINPHVRVMCILPSY